MSRRHSPRLASPGLCMCSVFGLVSRPGSRRKEKKKMVYLSARCPVARSEQEPPSVLPVFRGRVSQLLAVVFYDFRSKQQADAPTDGSIPPTPRPFIQESTVALAGLAALSPAATALSSYQEAADVADRLLVCLDSAVRQRCAGLIPVWPKVVDRSWTIESRASHNVPAVPHLCPPPAVTGDKTQIPRGNCFAVVRPP